MFSGAVTELKIEIVSPKNLHDNCVFWKLLKEITSQVSFFHITIKCFQVRLQNSKLIVSPKNLHYNYDYVSNGIIPKWYNIENFPK